ncbi:MAG: hypothetical protein GY855_17570, partial [candidate division Zixibacteria bacterium]|nr:hypothetical protein [candidate division Zixibacteria bacterium]
FNSVFSLIDYIQGDTLWPGDSTLITVAFEPPEYESYTDTIIHEIRSGPFLNINCPVILSGHAGRKQFNLEPYESINFGILCDTVVYRSLRLSNPSENNMDLIVSSREWFLNQGSVLLFEIQDITFPDTLSPGEFNDVRISFDADNVFDSLSAYLVLNHNATGSSGRDSIWVKGVVFCNQSPVADSFYFQVYEAQQAIFYLNSDHYHDPDNLPGTLRIIDLPAKPSWISWNGDTVLTIQEEASPRVDRDTVYEFSYILTDDADTVGAPISVLLKDYNNILPTIAPNSFVVPGDLQDTLSIIVTDPDGGPISPPSINMEITPRSRGILNVIGEGDDFLIVHPEQVYDNVLCSLYVTADDGYDSSFATIPITVVYNPNAESDIKLLSLTASPNPVKVRNSTTIKFVTEATNNDFRFPYDVAISTDDSTYNLMTMLPLAHDQRDSASISVRIDSLSRYEFYAELILSPESVDLDTTNNSLILTITTLEGEVIARPQPFTPNGDGLNDELIFDLTALYLDNPHLMIFSMTGVRLVTLSPSNKFISWDGKDESGRALPPGVYMYTITDGKRRIKSGVVTLAR